MAIKRQTRGSELAEIVELAAFLLDNEADNIDDSVLASDMAHTSVEFEAGSLPLNVFLHAMAAQFRDMAGDIRRLK